MNCCLIFDYSGGLNVAIVRRMFRIYEGGGLDILVYVNGLAYGFFISAERLTE